MNSKSALTSKSIWGSIICLVSMMLRQSGIDIGDEGVWVQVITEFFGAGLAIYGRVKAVNTIGGVIKKGA